jgi:hypothetical protein
MSEPTKPGTSPHASHDPALVAALAARVPGLTETQDADVRAQIAACADCADLLADLVALQTILPATSTPARPRDFRLTTEDAARLRASGWRRVLGFFGSARDNVTQPLAVGLTTLGLAGLLVATLPTMFGAGGAAMAPQSVGAPVNDGAAPAAGEAYGTERLGATAAPSGAAAASPAAASPAPASPAPAPSVAPEDEIFAGADPQDLEAQRDIAGDAAIRDDATGLSTLFVVAGMLLIAGLGLFGLRWSARRLL